MGSFFYFTNILGAQFGTPEVTYTYKTKDGSIAAYIYRFTLSGAKEFRPLTFGCYSNQGTNRWEWKNIPNNRPLYQLDEIVKHPGKTIIICEGEKAAIAAQKYFINDIATTSIGGSQAADKTDWTPLVGRTIIIWPDHDESGKKYMVDVAANLSTLGVQDICYIDTFDQQNKLEFKEKWDAADALEHRYLFENIIALKKPLDISNVVNSSQTKWREFKPLSTTPQSLLPVEKFDVRLLPESVRDWVRDIAMRMDNAPIDYAAVIVMTVLGSLLGRKVGIHPKCNDDWLVIPNLWGVIVGEPSVKKTPILNEIIKPIRILEKEAYQLFCKEITEYTAKEQVHKATQSQTYQAMKNGECQDNTNMVEKLIEEENSKPDKPTRKRYTTSDVTTEKLGSILSENPAGILLIRDELTGWMKTLDQTDKPNDRPFFLECWNGTGSYTSDRVGRGTIEIPSTTVGIIGTIQPAMLRPYLQNNTTDGFIERFQLAVYPDKPKFKFVDLHPDELAKEKAYKVFNRFADIPFADNNPTILKFSPEGQEIFKQFYCDLNKKTCKKDCHTHMQSHLAKYQSLMPAIALILHVADHGHTGTISKDTASQAWAWCEYLEGHAKRIYGIVDKTLAGVKSLLKNLATLPNPFTVTNFAKKDWGGLTTSNQRLDALNVLIENGYLATEEKKSPTKSSTLYHINPLAMEKHHD